MEEFIIIMDTYDHARKLRRKFSFNVEVLYRSNQVERYKLTGGDKSMTIEKNLLLKSKLYKNWKIKELTFKMEIVNEATVMALHDIYKKIDEHMHGKINLAFQRTDK